MRSWIWWLLTVWLAASLRKVLRLRRGMLVDGIVRVDGRIALKELGFSMLVGGEFLRRMWVAVNLARSTAVITAPLLA